MLKCQQSFQLEQFHTLFCFSHIDHPSSCHRRTSTLPTSILLLFFSPQNVEEETKMALKKASNLLNAPSTLTCWISIGGLIFEFSVLLPPLLSAIDFVKSVSLNATCLNLARFDRLVYCIRGCRKELMCESKSRFFGLS